MSFPGVGAATGVKPFEPLGKDSGSSSEGGNTGRRANWPCHIKFAWKGEFAETVRSASGRKPRIARVIRILRAKARDDVCNMAAAAVDIGDPACHEFPKRGVIQNVTRIRYLRADLNPQHWQTRLPKRHAPVRPPTTSRVRRRPQKPALFGPRVPPKLDIEV